MKLRATQTGTRTTIVRVDDAGIVVSVPFIDPFNSTSAYRKCAAHFNVPQQLIVDLLCNRTLPAEVDDTPPRPPVAFHVRQFSESGKGIPAADFPEALRLATPYPADTNIEWDGIAEICALDVDFDADLSPSPHELLMWAEVVRPVPSYVWLTRSDHLRLIYTSLSPYTADELAAVAAYQCGERFPTAKFEFLHRTRKPKGTVYTPQATADIESIRRLLGQHVPGDDYTDWLSARGLQPGGRYPHTQCPVDPNERAEGNDCVQVFDNHIKCHYCASHGRKYGSKDAGYFPLAALAGRRASSMVDTCVRHFTHWAQAKYVMARILHSEPVSERVYRALLKLIHGPNDPRIPLAFKACEPIGMLRSEGIWTSHAGEALKIAQDSAIIRALPACMELDADGKLQVRQDVAQQLAMPGIDLTPIGYPTLIPIRGIQITASQELPTNKLYAVVQTPALSPPDRADRRPKYVVGVDAARVEAAFDVLDAVVPGYDRKLIQLLIAGRGCVEHRSGKPPMLALAGPTGSGKTTHVEIAAAICGDEYRKVLYTQDQQRFRQAFLAGKDDGGFLCFDEFFKLAGQVGDTEIQAMESLLSFDENSLTHKLYVGAVRFGALPMMVWCDTDIPIPVMQHEQIGRRIFYHRLPSGRDWEPHLQASGISKPSGLRADGSPAIVAAMNEILSYVIDTYFRCPVTDFAQVASALGFKYARDCGGAEETTASVQILYDAVVGAPAITDEKYRHHFSKRGLKLAVSGNPVYDALNELWEDTERGTSACRKVQASDITRALKLSVPCRFEIRRKTANVLAVRFVSVDETLVNEELK